jgi:thioesterase-3
MIFEYPLLIREKHLDTFGHVNNAVYLQILEEARWEIIHHNGFGLDEIRKSGLGPVILEVNLRFLKELHLRKQVVIKSEVTSYKGKVGSLRQTIESLTGEIHALAEFKMGLFDTRERKLVEPTDRWLQALGVSRQT